MAYLDIASANSYGRFNIKFASLVGLNTAVYWSCIMNVLERVKDKKTYDNNGFFTLSRTYVEQKTTLTKEQQTECDHILFELGIIDIDPANANRLSCDVKKFFSLVAEEDYNIMLEIKRISKSATKEGKAEGKRIGIIHRLQAGLGELDPEIRVAYEDWITVVYDKGICKQAQVNVFVDAINKYTTDKQIKLGIIKLATTLAYREAEWAIKLWEKDHKPESKIPSNQKIGTVKTVNNSLSF